MPACFSFSVIYVDELFKKISKHSGQRWDSRSITQAGARRPFDEGADHYTMRVHYTGAVSREIECRMAQLSNNLWRHRFGQVLDQVHGKESSDPNP